jgi:hypothetical protein
LIYNLPTIHLSNWAIRESASATIIPPISASLSIACACAREFLSIAYACVSILGIKRRLLFWGHAAKVQLDLRHPILV